MQLVRWPIPRTLLTGVGKALDAGLLTARGFGRVQRLAWTVANLNDHARPTKEDVDLALSLRIGDQHTREVAA